jgi:hypothetical protein
MLRCTSYTRPIDLVNLFLYLCAGTAVRPQDSPAEADMMRHYGV